MTPFELSEPRTLQDALALIDPDDPSVRPIAGGTALMLMMKAGVFRPTRLVSLRRVADLSAIAESRDGTITIGAMTALAEVERSPVVRRQAPVITRTLRTLSNIRVRNVATVGGHLAHADPHMDLPPVLIALGAQVAVAGRAGGRTIPVEALFAGYFETVLGRDELISALMVPAAAGRRCVYLKCTTRAVHDWPALGVAVSLHVDGRSLRDARIVISAATEMPARLAAAERALHGGDIGLASLQHAAEVAAAEAQVMTDGQGSAPYKRELVRVYVMRALRAALAEEGGQH